MSTAIKTAAIGGGRAELIGHWPRLDSVRPSRIGGLSGLLRRNTPDVRYLLRAGVERTGIPILQPIAPAGEYRIVAGDVVHIDVWKHPEIIRN